MEKSEKNPRGAGRKPFKDGIKRVILATKEEHEEIKTLLKSIRETAKKK